MGRTVGFTLAVGAKLASSVGSVFDTVAGRAGKLKSEMKQLRAMSTAAGKVTTTQARVAELRAQSAGGKNVAAELAAAERAFASAQRSAAKYNISVADSAKVHARTTAQIARTESALKRQETLMRNQAKRQELKGEIMGTIASAGMVMAPIKVAIDFESAMADAAKTIDGMRDEAGKLTADYYKMETAVKQMGRELPLTHEELAKLFAAGGQMGMSDVEKLREFTTLSAHMAVAFGMSTEQASAAIGGYQTKLGLSADATREMLDLMNQFANTSSATEKDVAGIVGRVGALGGVAGIAHKPMTAMAATLASMKIPEEIAATGLKNFMLALSKGDAATKKQQEAFASLGIDSKELAVHMQKDAERAMLAVLEKIKRLPKEQQVATLTELFGSESLGAIAPMLTQLDLLKKNFTIAADSTQFAGAMQKEFENRSKTTANAIIITKNKMAELAITAGGALLPALNDVLASVGHGATVLAAFADAHPQVTTVVMGSVAALAALKVATQAVGFGVTGLSDAWQGIKAVWAFGTAMCQRATYAMIWQRTVSVATAVGTKVMAAAQWALNAALTANPIGVVIMAVSALAAGLAYLYNNCEPVRNALNWLWEGITTGLKPVFSLLESAWNKIKTVWGGIKKIASWFSSDEAKDAEDKADDERAAEAEAAAKAAPPAASPAPAPSGLPPMPTSGAMPGLPGVPAGFPMPQGGIPAGAFTGGTTSIQVTQQVQVSAEIKELRKEILEALKNSGGELERILGGLLKDKARVTYG